MKSLGYDFLAFPRAFQRHARGFAAATVSETQSKLAAAHNPARKGTLAQVNRKENIV